MKTIVVIVQLLCSVVLWGIFNTTDAQTIISFDASPDNTMVMKIRNPNLSDKPDMLILIFDSTTLTCEFSEDGIIALHTTENRGGTSVVTTSCSYYFPDKHEDEKSLSKSDAKVYDPPQDVEKEDTITLEDWMLRPDEWKELHNL